MENQLKALILEDNPGDAELNEVQLRKAGFQMEYHRAETREEYLKELAEFKPDIILADYKLPDFDGLAALQLAQERYPFIPFIIVSGVLQEEAAVELLKSGASDYVLKGNIKRLGPAVKNALEIKRAKEEKARAEEALRASYAQLEQRVRERTAKLEQISTRLQTVLNVLPVGVWVADTNEKIVMVNDAAAAIYGGKAPKAEKVEEYSVYEAFRPGTNERIPVEDYPLPRALRGETVKDMVIDHLRFDGGRGTHLSSSTPIRDSHGNITGGVVIALVDCYIGNSNLECPDLSKCNEG